MKKKSSQEEQDSQVNDLALKFWEKDQSSAPEMEFEEDGEESPEADQPSDPEAEPMRAALENSTPEQLENLMRLSKGLPLSTSSETEASREPSAGPAKPAKL